MRYGNFNQMKIAIDIREACEGKTGKGWYTYQLVQQILKIDKTNSYILYSNHKKKPFPMGKNVTYKPIEEKNAKWQFAVIKDLKGENIDLFFSPVSYIIPSLLPKNIKSVVTVHDLVAFLFPSSHNYKAILIERLTLKRALKKTSAIFVVSENTKKDLQKRFPFVEKKVFSTPCAPADFFKVEVKQKDLDAVKKKLKLPDNFILAVGTLEPRKNFQTLIKSFVIVKRKHPDYKLVIVGKKGWKYHLIEQALKNYKLEKEVIFPGYVDDQELQKVYKLAKVFVFPSLYEGFGIPPLEAMASGCPVVSSNVSSLPEVIGEAGLLVDPKNSVKIADAIVSLITNDQVRALLIERGYQQAEKFSWQQSAQEAIRIFENLSTTPHVTSEVDRDHQ